MFFDKFDEFNGVNGFSENNSPDFHALIKKRIKKTARVIGAAALLFAAVRIVLMQFYAEPDIQSYAADSDLVIRIFDWTAAAGVVALYVVSIFLYRYKKDEHHYSASSVCLVQGNQTQIFSASIAGFFIAASAVLQIWSISGLGQFTEAEPLMDFIKNNVFDILIFFASVLSAVYFFMTAAYNKEPENDNGEYSQGHIIMSMTPIIWAFLHTFKCFFDMSRSINSPVRIYELMSFLALSAYFVSESRMLVGRRGISRFFTFAYIAVLFVLVSALPNLILSYVRIAQGLMQVSGAHIMYAVQIALAFYIAVRIYSQIRYGKFQLER